MHVDLQNGRYFGGLGDAAMLSWIEGLTVRCSEYQVPVFKAFGVSIQNEYKNGISIDDAYRREMAEGGQLPRWVYIYETTGINFRISRPPLCLPDEVIDKARYRLDKVGRPCAVLFPEAMHAERQMPLHLWLKLQHQLQESGTHAVLCGTKPMPEKAAQVRAETVPDLMALCAAADTVYCNDSAPLHIACTLGTPTVAFLGPTNPNVFHYDELTAYLPDFPCVSCHWSGKVMRPWCKVGCEALCGVGLPVLKTLEDETTVLQSIVSPDVVSV
ncbi:hypothetical protein GC163_13305 [bacterium]|nr:hypothetical protein [bacterium]